MGTRPCDAWDIALNAGYVRACFGVWVQFSADNAELLAEWLIARAEKFRALAQRNHCADIPDAGPMCVALAHEAIAYALL